MLFFTVFTCPHLSVFFFFIPINSSPFYTSFKSNLDAESNHVTSGKVDGGIDMTEYLLTQEGYDLGQFNLKYPVAFEVQQKTNKKRKYLSFFFLVNICICLSFNPKFILVKVNYFFICNQI